jgi:CAAX prenyl protease-like protein
VASVGTGTPWLSQPGVRRSLPFALYIAFLAIEGAWGDIAAMAPALADIDPRWLYPVKAVAVALCLAWLWRYFDELRTRPGAGHSALAVAVGLAVFVLWINLDADWMLVGTMGAGYDPRGDWTLVAFRLAGAALVVPVMEELFWRSFIQRWLQDHHFLQLDPAAVGLKALFIASALFAIEHTQWLAGLVAGLAYGWLYIRTRNLWAPILAHAVTDGVLGVWVLMTGQWAFW